MAQNFWNDRDECLNSNSRHDALTFLLLSNYFALMSSQVPVHLVLQVHPYSLAPFAYLNACHLAAQITSINWDASVTEASIDN